jgi:hypothetical protein
MQRLMSTLASSRLTAWRGCYRSADEMQRAIWELLDSWRAERERRERERAETTRLAAVRAEQERFAREEADLHLASLFPSEVGRLGPTDFAGSNDRVPVQLAARNDRDHRNYRDDLVDRGNACNDHCRIAVARGAHGPLFP